MYVAKTDIGKKREKNEDYFMVEELDQTASVYVLADGMGGYQSGEVASKTCCLEIIDKIESLYYSFDTLDDMQIVNMLKAAIREANELVYNLEKTDEKYKGMGTTLVLIFVYGSSVFYASVGDSRIYVCDGKLSKLIRITEDDTYVNELLKKKAINVIEAKNHPQKNILTKAVGIFENIDVEVHKLDIANVKYIFAFSDGVTNMLKRADMMEIFRNNKFDKWADKIVDEANEKGGNDNSTAIIIEIEE
ncbi:MAG: Stp1/IreP family PP2C-type Ser/Thr phosphatase [Clostridia bacterium]|nr:Stp1/IreP family PP2C-type Ser/Thr phosphatase [Clostridia bacterium]